MKDRKLKELKQIVEEAQYNLGLDEFYDFLVEANKYVSKKLSDNEKV